MRTSSIFPCLLTPERGSRFLIWDEGLVQSQTGEVLRWFAHLIGSVVCRVHVYSMLLLFLTPAFAPTSSELAVEFPVFLYIVVHKLPQLDMATVFLVSIISLYFAAQ